MADEDFISALHQSVKREVVNNYLNERCIVEEEINILLEDTCGYHGGLAAWEEDKTRLAGALLAPQAADRFFALAGLELPSWDRVQALPLAVPLSRPRGLTRAARYRNLVGILYEGLWGKARELGEERGRLEALMNEVNADIRRFEANYDLMSLSAYLRTLDPVEIRRRKILGVNFTARENQVSAEALSFRPLTPLQLALDDQTDRLYPPDQVMPAAADLLKQTYRDHAQLAERYLI